MKILVVDPGADWSTADVYTGLVAGLRAAGQEVEEFRYSRRMGIYREALHTAWVRGRRVGPQPGNADAGYLASEAVVTKALREMPDFTLIVSGMYFHPDALVLMRRAGLKTALLLTESPYDFEKERVSAALADVVWTNEVTAVDPLREVNSSTRYLAHAWHPGRHAPGRAQHASDVPRHDVCFVGTGFFERSRLIKGVDWTGIDLGLYGTWHDITKVPKLRRFVRAGVIENDLGIALYKNAKINLNLFRTSVGFGEKALHIYGAQSLGPRAYELAACGCFFFSERRDEVTSLFGDLVPTFEGPQELQALLTRWLPDDSGRRDIAARLPATVAGQSWAERAQQVVADLDAFTAGRRSTMSLAAVPQTVAS